MLGYGFWMTTLLVFKYNLISMLTKTLWWAQCSQREASKASLFNIVNKTLFTVLPQNNAVTYSILSWPLTCRVWQRWTSQMTPVWSRGASLTPPLGCGASHPRNYAGSNLQQVNDNGDHRDNIQYIMHTSKHMLWPRLKVAFYNPSITIVELEIISLHINW
jgi:hypothetical protein